MSSTCEHLPVSAPWHGGFNPRLLVIEIQLFINTFFILNDESPGSEHVHPRPTFYSQNSLEAVSPTRRESRSISPAFAERELMHHIVDESLGSEFRTFYKLTSPVRKTFPDGSLKKEARNSVFF